MDRQSQIYVDPPGFKKVSHRAKERRKKEPNHVKEHLLKRIVFPELAEKKRKI